MYQDANFKFNESGFYLAKGLFNEKTMAIIEKDFDRVVDQIKKSGENINARWGSKLTEHIESQDSSVIHTHNVQGYSHQMLKMIQDTQLLDVTESLIGDNIILHHTKLFLKPPKNGSAFPLHQDWSYFPTKENSMIAAVVHLSDCHNDMGRIRVIEGSHELGRIQGSDGHSSLEEIHGKYDLESATPVTAKKGDVFFFHCCTLHGSKANRSNYPRKTILIQLYSGNDKIEESSHTNLQLTLRGWNYHATRNSLDSIRG